MTKSDGEPRRTIPLDGDWEFVTDPDDDGVDAGWDAADAEWPGRARTITVPVAWEELDDCRTYAGTAWYRRTVDVPADALADRDALLRFDAVDHETTVWVNGERVGHNRGGYLPFEVDATGALSPGENVVVARVTDPADLREIPHGKQGDPWYTRVSGIWQSVHLDLRPPARVRTAEVTPDLDTDTAIVDLDVASGPRDPAALTWTVAARRGDRVVATASGTVAEETEAVLAFEDPDYWWPDDPALYDLVVELRVDGVLVDRYEDTFGLRSFAADGDRFLLNGEPIVLRGVLEQGYYPETLYRPPDGETFEREVAVAADLGFNLIRKHIKPAHPDFLDVADREGMLVWEELANPTGYTERSRRAMTDQLDGLVDRDYNHPSVVVWGLYNEEWGIGHEDGEEPLWTDERKQRFLADLVRSLREHDPTRVVCDNSGWAHVATDVNDFHRYFVSPDRAAAWEADLDHTCHHPGDNYATTDFEAPDAPIVVSELGTWGLPDVAALRERYDGDPPWFDHDFLTEPHKRPAGVDDRFAATDMPAVFGDFDALAAAWQRREFVSVKHVLEQLRVREPVAGYVLTELSDIEWEFNGVLDYLREEKAFHDEVAAVNGPVAVVAEPASHVGWAGDDLAVTVTVVNDTGETLAGTVSWSLSGVEGSADLTAVANGPTALDERVAVPLPADGLVERADLRFEFEGDGRSVATTEPVVVVDGDRLSTPDATVYAEGGFASRLARTGVAVTYQLGPDVDVAFADRPTGAVESFAADGGSVVHLPGPDGRMVDAGPFAYRDVPEAESWVGAASFFYQDSPLFDGLVAGPRLGWELEGLYPLSVATGLDADADRVHAGYVEGWLANWGSPLVERDHGAGSVTACTFDVRAAYGDHPAATVLCDRLIRRLASG